MPIKNPDSLLITAQSRLFLTITILLFFSLSQVFSQSYDGYTSYFPQGGTKAYLVNLEGSTLHSWTFASNIKNLVVFNRTALPGTNKQVILPAFIFCC